MQVYKKINGIKLRKSKDSSWIGVGTSKIAGKGVYAMKDIPKETEIIEYDGEIVNKDEGTDRSDTQNEKGNFYIFGLNDKQDIDGAKGGDAKYINHSCDPNCEAVNYDDEEVWIVALRDIKKGEELSYDYGAGDDEECRCGAPNCKGNM
jgi:uncharacterized protein